MCDAFCFDLCEERFGRSENSNLKSPIDRTSNSDSETEKEEEEYEKCFCSEPEAEIKSNSKLVSKSTEQAKTKVEYEAETESNLVEETASNYSSTATSLKLVQCTLCQISRKRWQTVSFPGFEFLFFCGKSCAVSFNPKCSACGRQDYFNPAQSVYAWTCSDKCRGEIEGKSIEANPDPFRGQVVPNIPRHSCWSKKDVPGRSFRVDEVTPTDISVYGPHRGKKAYSETYRIKSFRSEFRLLTDQAASNSSPNSSDDDDEEEEQEEQEEEEKEQEEGAKEEEKDEEEEEEEAGEDQSVLSKRPFESTARFVDGNEAEEEDEEAGKPRNKRRRLERSHPMH